MPTPVSTARQCLTQDASLALDEAVSVARRRGHSQTTSLHAVSALLSLPSSTLLRDACSRNSTYSLRLQFKALDLSLSVSLDRTPSTTTTAAAVTEPPISNSLMAAIKRSQANQRRNPHNFHLYHNGNGNHQNAAFSVSALKVELRHFVLSILDDPVVSRVFSEAGFRSSEIKLAIMRPIRYRAPPLFLCNLPPPERNLSPPSPLPGRSFFNFPFSGDSESENLKSIGEILCRSKGKNPILLGACAKDALKSFIESTEREKQLPLELCGLKVLSVENDVVEFCAGNCGIEVLKKKFEEIELILEKSVGPGVVLNFGDLKGFIVNDNNNNNLIGYVVEELGKLLKVHSNKLWLIGAVASYEIYLKFVGMFPSVDKDWNLQLLPITSLQSYHRPRSSLMNSFVPFGGFFSSPSESKGSLNGSYYCVPSCHQCGERCEHEVPAASKERFSASAPDPCHSNLPPWLQIAEFGKTKGFNLKTNGDDRLLDSTESRPPDKNLDKTCQHLHQTSPDTNTCKTVVGFHCIDNKKADADNHSSKITDTPPAECINFNSEVPVDVQMTTSQSSSPFPVIFKAKQDNYTSKLSEMSQKVEDLESGDLRSCNMSNSSVCDGSQMFPASVTSVTTDLGLGICSSPTSNKSKKPTAQQTTEPPKEIPSRFSSNFNLDDGNFLKHQSQSSSCLSFDYCVQLDAKNTNILFEALSKEVNWQDEALRVIVKTILSSPTKGVKQHGANRRGDIWMNFVGPDRHGKRKVAVALAEFLYGSRESFIFVDLSSEEMKGCNVKFRGKTTVDFIVGEYCKKPLSVVFLENVDKADMVVQRSLSQAIKTGKIADSHGRVVSLNNATFVTSFLGYHNSLMPTTEPSKYSEERILSVNGGSIKIKVEHVIGDIRSQSGIAANSSTDAIPNIIFVNKRKLIGENEFHDRHLISDAAKRAHTTSNWLLDLNLPAEENELQQLDDGNSENASTENRNRWLQDLYNQIESEVVDQLLAAAYVSDRDAEIENWVDQVLCGGFVEVQRRHNLTTCSIVKLATCPEQASSVYLPPRIILE
ncbi:PREDICTED: protein SMAX1-LIKE 6-like isoform X2 [Lupinus angustifolius]|uniref:protein SMAX1-LIKE 6-like isoform X2 n=1 Tax=Lupinus angustifolius TaxID=3871 RepID=UPI00092F7771|nr:PREDICTED: protein SMAX1-LIKE 6-like isoform X2 [Lupinus angustifolius]